MVPTASTRLSFEALPLCNAVYSIVASVAQAVTDCVYYIFPTFCSFGLVPVRFNYVRDQSHYSQIVGLGYWFCISGARIHKSYLGEWANLPALLASGRVTELADGMIKMKRVYIVPTIGWGIYCKGQVSFLGGIAAGMACAMPFALIEHVRKKRAQQQGQDPSSAEPVKKKGAMSYDIITLAMTSACLVAATIGAYKTWNLLERVYPTVRGIYLF